MKAIAIVLAALLAVTAVFAMGLPVSTVFDDVITVDEDGKTVTFHIKGDNNVNSVDVFVSPSIEGYLLVDDDEIYMESFVFDPYQDRAITVELTGVKNTNRLDDDVLPVQYGFYYQKYGIDDDFGFKQLVSSTFDVEVDCSGCTTDTATTTSTNTGSATSGASVAFTPPAESSEQKAKTTNVDGDVSITDIAPDSSSLTEAVVDTSINTAAVARPVPPTKVTENAVPAGKGAAMSLLILLVITLMVNYVAIQHVKQGDD